ncbi:DUF262 domain-containing protein [Hyphomonas sp. UBA4494]|jgi:hypothetical protein|uniref:DUF262 domain-containing protein n=1 Tax=Hyphomonas sp. UBA4494 TaxID=1946631 RepID=UPI0025C1DFF9|nr:DUF262 domain-containing protein [Hyphomonas sp. UBA4494]
MSDLENDTDHDMDDDVDVQDEKEGETGEEEASPPRFDISSYGWDVDVEGLVNRMNRKDIYVPGFQRGFVWSGPEKSRFIESLILGLPVPTLFLARDSENQNKLNIIDGQQRLKTLQSYVNGEFSLSGKDIPDDLKGCYHSNRRVGYRDRRASPKAKILNPADERTLSDAVIHSIIIRPNPKDDDINLGREYNKAIIQIFKRLNTTGKALNAQEVRASIFHGPLLSLIQELNENEDWRTLFGKVHSRLKDQEAILRAIALFENGNNYKSPMPKFLNDFMEDNRNLNEEKIDELRGLFALTVKLIRQALGDDALKQRGTFVLTRYDALAHGIMSALSSETGTLTSESEAQFLEKLGDRTIAMRLNQLESDSRGMDENGEEVPDYPAQERGYNWSIAKFTNDTNRVDARLRTARNAFAIA